MTTRKVQALDLVAVEGAEEEVDSEAGAVEAVAADTDTTVTEDHTRGARESWTLLSTLEASEKR